MSLSLFQHLSLTISCCLCLSLIHPHSLRSLTISFFPTISYHLSLSNSFFLPPFSVCPTRLPYFLFLSRLPHPSLTISLLSSLLPSLSSPFSYHLSLTLSLLPSLSYPLSLSISLLASLSYHLSLSISLIPSLS
jgi:hypothetical protein